MEYINIIVESALPKYKKGVRVIVNLNTSKKPEYYVGTVTSIRKGIVKVIFDDGEKGNYKPTSSNVGLVGITESKKKRKTQIPTVNISKWIDLPSKKLIKKTIHKGRLSKEEKNKIISKDKQFVYNLMTAAYKATPAVVFLKKILKFNFLWMEGKIKIYRGVSGNSNSSNLISLIRKFEKGKVLLGSKGKDVMSWTTSKIRAGKYANRTDSGGIVFDFNYVGKYLDLGQLILDFEEEILEIKEKQLKSKRGKNSWGYQLAVFALKYSSLKSTNSHREILLPSVKVSSVVQPGDYDKIRSSKITLILKQ